MRLAIWQSRLLGSHPLLVGLFAGLWLVLGIAGDGTKRASAKPAAAPTPAAVTTSAPRRLEPLYVPPVSSSLPGLPSLGEELSTSLIAVLREANLDARAGTPPASGHGESDNVLVAQLESAGGDRVRLVSTFRGTTVNAASDLEHLDDLVYAVFEQLRPRLLAEVAAVSSAVPPSEKPVETPPIKPHPPSKPDKIVDKLPAKVVVRPISTLPPSKPEKVLDKLPSKPPEKPEKIEKPPEKVVEKPLEKPPEKVVDPPTVPVQPVPTVQPVPARVRVAVHVVGEPVLGLPPSFYGIGASSQQIILHYLQARLRVAPVPSRLVGLVGGLEALTQSLRLGARHTLMARFDTLSEGYGAYGSRTLSGRLHIVLLLDSRPLLDRSLVLPPTAYYPTEAPAAVMSRLLGSAMDSIAADLHARLYATP